MAGAFAAAPQSGLPWPRFPSPLIEPDVPISGIRLSDLYLSEEEMLAVARRELAKVETAMRRAGQEP